MHDNSVLRSALKAIQSSGLSAKVLADRSGLSVPTCRKILEDYQGRGRYHWTSIEFALRYSGSRLIVVAERGEARKETQDYIRRSGRRSYYESRN